MLRRQQNGHTLPELLIAITLVFLIFAALIPLNSLGLKSLNHQQDVHSLINRVQLVLSRLKTDLSRAGSTGCLLNKSNLYDYHTQKKSPGWLALLKHTEQHWYPSLPSYYKVISDALGDALNLKYADLSKQIKPGALTLPTMGIYYVTNCDFAEIISLNNNQSQVVPSLDLGALYIFPYQSITYQIRQIDSTKTLYRQYITKTEKLRNEPLMDGVENISFGFAEQHLDNSIMFKAAENILDWNNIAAIYSQFEIKLDDLSFIASQIILLENHAGN